jgi:hypothetical protein
MGHSVFRSSLARHKGDEIAVEFRDAVRPDLLTKMQDHFGDGGGAENLATRNQIASQFDMVEDFVVEAHPNISFGRRHRPPAADGAEKSCHTAHVPTVPNNGRRRR